MDLWSVHSRAASGAMRTNNNAELFHRHFRAQFSPGVRPSLPKAIESLQKQQYVTMNDAEKIRLGEQKRQKPQSLTRDSRIKALMDKHA
eukprot:10300383-Karenia_brevis.AAC.1